MNIRILCIVAVCIALRTTGSGAVESQCFGTVANGRIEGSVKLPVSGPNFVAYSKLGAAVGRTYVHSKVARTITAAYAEIAAESPKTKYVYGETGLASGGRLRPHRTHQNGLSVDFFVPVLDADGKSVVLPTNVTNKLGYDIEFGPDARFAEYEIDFNAMSEHLYQLHKAATNHGVRIAMVIFDVQFLPKLFATRRGTYLRQNLSFMEGKPWIRHDEHYHIDFAVPCKPNAGK